MTATMRSVGRTAMVLLAFAVAGTALLTFVHHNTRDRIARMQEEEKLALIGEIIAPDHYDNEILKDAVELAADPALGTDQPRPVFRARKDGRPVAAVFEVVGREGYGARINMIVAVDPDGRVLGVRVVSHNETPGLGDYIEAAKDDWIRQFDGAALAAYPAPEDFGVRKDGGKFDYRAGATVTSRAVVKALRLALEYYAAHPDRFWQQDGPQGGPAAHNREGNS